MNDLVCAPGGGGIAGSAHAALSLRCVHLPFRWFCHDAAHYWYFNVCASIHYRCAKFCLTFLNGCAVGTFSFAVVFFVHI